MKISIGIPTRGDICIETMLCLLQALPYTNQELGCEFVFNFHKGTYLHELRNNIVKDARENNADYLMFIDTDLTFDHDGIVKLVKSDKDIIGGMYNMKSLPLVTTIKIADENGKRLDIKQFEVPKDVFKCHAIPTGFMLIKMSSIKDMEFPFGFDRDEEKQLVGEDIKFCIDAQALGLDIWCDPTIKIGHIGQYVY